MAIKQGDIYWVPVYETGDPQQAYAHPHVIVQEDASSSPQ
jgi:mRNA-degrading endonuclease toxin of MazEF toxin-antitoxin module